MGDKSLFCCSFCGRNQEEVRRLVAGQEPGVFICNGCVEDLKEERDTDKERYYTGEAKCSFCGHLRDDVGFMIQARESDEFICNDCLYLCGELLEEQENGDGKKKEKSGQKMGESDFTAYFDQAGEINTEKTIELATQRCKDLDIKHIVVATSTGKTALKVADKLEGQDVKIIAVTLHAGTWEKYVAPDRDNVKIAEAMGVKFLTCTHALMGNVGNAIMEKFGGVSLTDLIAHTYYTFSQGTKVAVEIAVMAADAGLIPVDQEVISIAGSDKGADTALVIKPAYSTDFFSLRVRELIAKPR